MKIPPKQSLDVPKNMSVQILFGINLNIGKLAYLLLCRNSSSRYLIASLALGLYLFNSSKACTTTKANKEKRSDETDANCDTFCQKKNHLKIEL